MGGTAAVAGCIQAACSRPPVAGALGSMRCTEVGEGSHREERSPRAVVGSQVVEEAGGNHLVAAVGRHIVLGAEL